MDKAAELALKHGIKDLYDNACKKERDGWGNGWRIGIERALEYAERGGDLKEWLSFWTTRGSSLISHQESVIRHRR